MKTIFHRPVLLKEVLETWGTNKGGIILDATVGTGGHAEAILRRYPKITLIGLDLDPAALEITKKRLQPFKKRVHLLNENFTNLPAVLAKLKMGTIDGFLADLGTSSLQLESPERGFSFLRAGPLDMRMNPSHGKTALQLILDSSESELSNLIRKFGEEGRGKAIASALKKAAAQSALKNTLDCAEVVSRVVIPKKRKIHPATKTFQALRIAVNNELENLENLLKELPRFMARGARSVFITFHSLEDRLVKSAIQSWSRGCICPPAFPQCVCGKKATFKILTTKPVVPQAEEIESNPRSRSAKMRVAEKI